MRKILSLLLVVCTLLPLFAACSKADKITLFESGSVTIVYDDALLKSSEAKAFATAVKEKTGVSTMITAKYEAGEEPKILLGNLNVEHCRSVTGEMRAKDYALCVRGGDYVIGAVATDALQEAMDHFLNTVLADIKNGILKLSSKNDYTYLAEYKTQAFSLGGVGLSNVKIVIPKSYTVSEYRTAALLKQHLSTSLGYELDIVYDKADAPDGRIVIGTSLCDSLTVSEPHSYAVAVKGNEMQVAAESFYGYEAVQDVLQKQIFKGKTDKSALDDSVSVTGTGNAADAVLNREGDVRVMFHNIHGFNSKEFPTKPVAMMMSEVFLEYLPDVLGIQEYHDVQSNGSFEERMTDLYALVDVKSNATPLFYRTDTVEVLDKGYFGFGDIQYTDPIFSEYWQGEDPAKLLTTNISQSTGEAVGNRKDTSKGFTWAIFRLKATGNVFLVASTHLWWESNDTGDSAVRRIQLATLKSFLETKAKTYAEGIGATTLPIFVGGDYNSAFGNSKTAGDIAVMINESPALSGEGKIGRFTDLNSLAPDGKRNDTTTHHQYATWDEALGIYVKPDKTTNDYKYAIDYIFSSKSGEGMFTVKRSAMSKDNYSYLSSDHSPILADIAFTADAPKI